MRRALLVCCLLGSAASFALPGFGAEAGKRPVSALEGVKELEKPVTYTETKIPLGELVQKVAKDTGAPLTAAKEVADEPVAVVVKDLPARELLEQLAELLDYRWSRRPPSPPRSRSQAPAKLEPANLKPGTVFEIWQDFGGKAREEALREAARAEAERRLREEVERYVEMAALTPEEIRGLVAEYEQQIERMNKLAATLPREQYLAMLRSPEAQERSRRFRVAYSLSAPVQRALANMLGRLTPEHWETLRRDGEITFSTDPAPGELPLPAEVARTFRASQASAYLPRLRTDPDSDPQNEEQVSRHNQAIQEQWSAASGYRVLIRLDRERSIGRPGDALRLDAFATPFRSGASVPASLWDRGPAPQLYLTADSLDVGARRPGRTPEERAALEKDPILGRKRRFVPDPKPRLNFLGRQLTTERQLQELLPDMARAYGVNFISDAYWNAPLTYVHQFPDGEPTALFELLDRFAGSYHRWEQKGGLIRLRSRAWFFDRRREVPLRVVRRWQDLCVRHGALPFEEYLSIVATLNEEQMESLPELIGESQFPSDLRDLWSVWDARHPLRLYLTLAPAQRQALWHGAALSVAQMTPRQRDLFLATLKESHRYRPVPLDRTALAAGSFSLSAAPSVRLREVHEGAIQYRAERAPVLPGAVSGTSLPPPAESRQAGGAPAGTPPAGTRFAILQLQFQCSCGPDLRQSVPLTVASLP